jgi:hypothetical protein
VASGIALRRPSRRAHRPPQLQSAQAVGYYLKSPYSNRWNSHKIAPTAIKSVRAPQSPATGQYQLHPPRLANPVTCRYRGYAAVSPAAGMAICAEPAGRESAIVARANATSHTFRPDFAQDRHPSTELLARRAAASRLDQPFSARGVTHQQSVAVPARSADRSTRATLVPETTSTSSAVPKVCAEGEPTCQTARRSPCCTKFTASWVAWLIPRGVTPATIQRARRNMTGRVCCAVTLRSCTES